MSDYKKVASGLLVSLLGLSLMAQVQAAGKKGRTPRVAAKQVQQPQSEVAVPEAAVEEGQVQQVPAQVKQQVPGYYRMMVGQFEVTALFDGTFDFHPDLLKNMDPAQVNQILMHHYGQTTKIQSPINGYLVHTGDHLVLIDAGAGKLFGKDQQGHIRENFKAAGYQPEQVDTIILTHLHGDHTGGLSKDGKKVFPNAVVYVNKVDNQYWLSEQTAAKAPLERQIFFKLAQQSTRPYVDGEHWKPIEAGTEIVPGIKAVAAYGHTPGHSALEIESNGSRLLVWGDIVHSHAIQFAHPEVSIEYDSDTEAAKTTRYAFMKRVADSHELVAGMHLPFPGIGHVVPASEGTYTWVPVEYAPLAK